MQFLREKKKAYLISVLVLWVVLWGLLLNGRTKIQKYQMKDTSIQYTTDQIDTIAGYKVDQDELKVKDDIYYMEFFTKDSQIKSLQISFAKPYEYDATIKIYYSDIYGGFTELKTLEQAVGKGDTSLTFNIPVEDVQGIHVCIPNDFSLETIDVSEHEAELVTVQKSHLKILPFFIFDTLFSFLSVAAVFCWLSGKEFQKDTVLLRLKRFGVRTGIIAGTVILLGIAQYFLTAQFAVISSDGIKINYLRLLFTIAFAIFGWGFWWLRKDWAKAPEKLFALIVLTAGTVITLAMPMLSERSWDAAIHYQNTMSLASAFEDEYHYMDVGHLIISNNLNEMSEINTKYNTEFLTSGVVENNYQLKSIYGSLGHVPAAVGTFLAKGLGLSLISRIWMARFFVLLFYTTIMYCAIRHLKAGKMIMALIGLYPTCVMLASNYSYDPWILSLTMLGFSYLSTIVVTPEEKLCTKDCAIMFTAFVLGFGPKPVYFPLLLLTLFISPKKFATKKSRRNYYLAIVGATCVVLALMLVPMLFSGGVSVMADTRGGGDINPTAQLNFIFTYPLTYTKTLLNFLKYYWSLSNSANYMVLLAYIGTAKFHYVVLGLIILVILTDSTGKQIYKCSPIYRVASGLAVFGTSAIVATVFYLVYTGVGYDAIGGCQPRYVLPALFPAAFALRNNYIDLKIKREYYNAAVFVIAAFVIWFAVLQMIVRPYIIH